MIFRNDDINPNSDFSAIREMYAAIAEKFPDARIVSAFNVLAQKTTDGSAYAALKPVDIDFAALDLMLDLREVGYLAGISEIASHGLAHLDHRASSGDLQRISIVGSCRLLGSRIFVPPFLRWNEKTEDICRYAGIELMGAHDAPKWINLDNEPVRPGRDLYVFHSWKFKDPAEFIARLG